jgi:hypothetical protein
MSKLNPKSEADIKALVKDWFDAHDAWHFAPVQNGLGVHGIPDRIGVVPVTVTQEMVGKRIGLFVAVEAKRPGRLNEQDRGMSKHQVLVKDGINDARGFAICCDGAADLKDLDMMFVGLGW